MERSLMSKHDERREGTRHIACFPAHIQRTTGSARTAVIRDLSVSGVLLLTRANLEVGEDIQLNLYLSESDSEARVATGRVVRVETRTLDRAEVWPYGVAVQLDEPLHDCEAEIRDLEARQGALGLPRD
jgi:hypothetical protein